MSIDERVVFRPARASDEAFLYRMLAFAASMDGSDESVRAARSDSTLHPYVDGFGREGDIGLIAEREGVPVGAAWLRVGEPTPSKVWTRDLPELAIATLPEVRGRGVGEALLGALIAEARPHHRAIALSVREGNPAVRLYERFGFVVERRIVNRVGTTSLAMRLDLE